MNTKNLWIASGFTVILFASAGIAKPNFSGDWKLNAAKSEFGSMTPPTSIVQKITHNEPSIRVVTTQVGEMGEFTVDSSYTTDGKECVNKFQDLERKSSLKWDGDMLVIDSRMDVQGHPITVTEKWILSDDGKTLTVSRHIVGPEGETDIRTVMEKQ